MNDATGLVAFKFALAAVVAGAFSLTRMAAAFSVLSAGGLAIGFAAAYGVGKLRDLLRRLRATDSLVETTLSLMTPYAAFLLTGRPERLRHPRGHRRRRPLLGLARPRPHGHVGEPARTAYGGVVSRHILAERDRLCPARPAVPRAHRRRKPPPATTQLLGLTAAISGTAILARLVWVFPATYLPFCLKSVRRSEARPLATRVFVVGWAGMRRARSRWPRRCPSRWSLPDGSPFPGRDIVIFLAFGVIATTLVLQGTTLEWVIRRLGIHGDEDSVPTRRRLARMTAVEAGLNALRGSSRPRRPRPTRTPRSAWRSPNTSSGSPSSRPRARPSGAPTGAGRRPTTTTPCALPGRAQGAGRTSGGAGAIIGRGPSAAPAAA